MLNTIKGPITFAKGKELHQKVKDFVKDKGMKLPFNVTDFTYKNSKLDSWLRAKVGKKKYKYNRTTKKWAEELLSIKK